MPSAIVVYWKKLNIFEVYSSLFGFIEYNESYACKRYKIEYRISNKKEAFNDDHIRLERVEYIKRK